MGKIVTVVKEFVFEAAHFLPNYDGPCRRHHGHSYKLQIGVKGEVNEETGMVVDFCKLKEKVNTWIIQHLDHAMLNEVDVIDFPRDMPTAENMVIWMLEWLQSAYIVEDYKIEFIRLWETATSYAEVRA